MRKTFRWLLCLLFAVSTASALAILVKDHSCEDVLPLSFDGGTLNLPSTLQSGSEYDFQVQVQNHTQQTARIVGSLDYCGGACYSVPGLPKVIPAGGRGTVTVHVKAGAPGELDEGVTFYTDQPTQPTLSLKIVGTIGEALAHDNSTHAKAD